MKYVAFLRGVNVGGKNTISMADLKVCFEDLGYADVSTYINSGNVLFSSGKSAEVLMREIEQRLVTAFKFDSELIKTLVISKPNFKAIIDSAPKGFGNQPKKYHSDVMFLIGNHNNAMAELELHPDVDKAWESKNVIYFQRLSAKRTKSKLSKIISKPIYKSITIRSWNTVQKLRQKLD